MPQVIGDPTNEAPSKSSSGTLLLQINLQAKTDPTTGGTPCRGEGPLQPG